jgi:phenylpropionate dioxygenase-like ring-hydroxylating dioxygenase large terminal subunit
MHFVPVALHCRYPVAPLAQLDPSKPSAVQLMGMDLVLWRDREGTWRYVLQHVLQHMLKHVTGRVGVDNIVFGRLKGLGWWKDQLMRPL